MVEAVGLEPTSGIAGIKVSTGLAHVLVFSIETPMGRILNG